MTNNDDKIWLIKSSGRILGPMSYDEVVQGLRSKEIVILDEIARPYSRWKYLRDEDIFESIIHELRNRDFVSHEHTQTGTHSLTESTTEVVKGNNEKTVYVLPESSDSADSKEVPPTKAFGVTPDTKRLNRVLTFFLILLISAISFFYTRDNEQPVPSHSLEESKKKALYYKNMGDFETAKKEFMISYNLNPDDNEVALGLAGVLIALQDTVSAERIITSILSKDVSVGIKKRAYNYLGIIYLNHFDLEKGRDQFTAALQIDPEYSYVLYNLGMVQYLNKNYAEANAQFKKSLEFGNDSPALVVMMVQMVSDLYSKERERLLAYAGLLDLLKKYELRLTSNFQEIQIVYAYLLFKNKNFNEALSTLEKALDYDPQEGLDFVKEIEIFEDKTEWFYLNQWLREMSGEFKKSARLEALLGLSYFKIKDRVQAKNLIDHAIKISPQDNVIKATSSYIYFVSEKKEDAWAALMDVRADSKELLPLVLRARYCAEADDMLCAQEYWEKVLNLNSKSLAGLHGMAVLNFKKNDFTKTQNLIQMGLNQAPRYKPLLQLKMLFDEKNK